MVKKFTVSVIQDLANHVTYLKHRCILPFHTIWKLIMFIKHHLCFV